VRFLPWLLAAFGLLTSTDLDAAGWVFEECPPEKAAALVSYQQQVREARSGSPLYLPRPYPKTLADLLMDLEYTFREIWRSTPEKQIPVGDQRLLAALASGKVRGVWQGVTDWTFIRCGGPGRLGQGDLFVLLLSDEEGKPLGRFAFRESGQWAAAQFPQETDPAEPGRPEDLFGDATDLAGTWRTVLRAAPTQAQWVVTHGTVRCPLVAPCLAFQAAGWSYLVQRGELFRLVTDGEVLRASEILSSGPRTESANAVLARVEPGKRHLVTVGYDRVVFAERVEP
jgi:hypothetical protein